MTGAYRHRQAAWRLTVDGTDISPIVRPRLISLSLTEKRGADADELELQLSDDDGQLEIPPEGATITLSLGWRDLGSASSPVLIDKGRFKVDETCHTGTPDVLTIRARSADLTRAFRNRRAQSWRDTTLGGVLEELAGRNGLQLRCAADLAAIAVDHLAQSRESDAAFLARLGRLHDAVATVKNQALIFSPCGSGQTAGGQDLGLATITRASGDRHSWKQAGRGAYTGVIADWQDRAGGRRRSEVVGSEGNAKRLKRTFGSAKAARRAAETERKRLARGGADFSLTLAIGRPDLFPEKKLQVEGFKPAIDAQDWLISEVQHRLDAQNGLATTLQMERGGGTAAGNVRS